MKKFLLVSFIFAIIFILSAIPAQAEIPADKQYIIKMAAYSLAMDIRNEATSVDNHYERLMLANQVLTSPGAFPNKIAEVAEAAQWGSAIDWTSITDAQIKNAMSGVWNHLAIAQFGEAPVRPVAE